MKKKTSVNKHGCLWFFIGFFSLIFAGCCGLLIMFMMTIVFIVSPSSAPVSAFSRAQPFIEEFESGSFFSSNKIAVIDITGIISDSESSWGGRIVNSDMIVSQIRAAGADHAVKAVILRLDTPGGEVTAADKIYYELMKMKEDTGKPLIASMGALAASGGVYVAVAADYIIANKLTTTGSIGVIAQTYNYVELFKKVGLEAETYTSGPMKDLLSGSRPRTQEEVVIIQEIIDEIYNDFVKIVAEGRPKLEVEDILGTPLGDGRILTGKQALEYGLVDSLGYFDDAVKKAISMGSIPENDYQVINYSRRLGFLDIFSRMQSGNETKIKVELPGSPFSSKMPDSGKFFFLPSGQ